MEQQQKQPMAEQDKPWVFRKYQECYASFRPETQLPPTAMAALWSRVSRYDLATYKKAIKDLGDTWRGEYPPNPGDVAAECQRAIGRAESLAGQVARTDVKAVALLEESFTPDEMESGNWVKNESERLMREEGLTHGAAICKAIDAMQTRHKK